MDQAEKEISRRNVATVDRMFDCVRKKDIEGWAALWHPDGRHIFPAGDGTNDLNGLAALRGAAEAKFADRSDVRLEVSAQPMADPRFVFAVLSVAMRLSSSSPPFATTLWCRFEFDEEGLILEQQEIFDGAAIQRAMSRASQDDPQSSDRSG